MTVKVKPIRQRYVQSVRLDATGAGSVSVTARGDFVVQRVVWTVVGTNGVAATNQSTAIVTNNGDQFDGTYSGNADTAYPNHLMLAGDILTCVWTGGDVGAAATFTLYGIEYPAGQGIEAVGGAGGPPGAGPTNPVVGGVTLIRNAIQSANYVAGVSGWAITRAGSAEFNNATVRGSIIAGGGNVVVDSSGVDVHSVPQNTRYRINVSGGFIASLLSGDDGRYAKVTLNIGAVGGGIFSGSPRNPLPNGAVVAQDGLLAFGASSVGLKDTPNFLLETPNLTAKVNAAIRATGQSSTSAVDDSSIDLDANDISLGATANIFMDTAATTYTKNLVNTPTLLNIPPAQLFNATVNVNIGDTAVALGATNYPNAFPAGSVIWGVANINSGAGNSSLWYARFLTVSNTQFNVIVYRPAAAAAAFALPIQILCWVVA